MTGSIDVPIWEKYSLSIPEAAAYFRVGEHRLRTIVSDNPHADFILIEYKLRGRFSKNILIQ